VTIWQIKGGSNGGLLWRYNTQRPDFNEGSLARSRRFWTCFKIPYLTAGAGWAYDYGTPEDNEEMFKLS